MSIKLIKKFQKWRDGIFLKRLEKVINNNTINANLILKGNLIILDNYGVYVYVKEENVADINIKIK